ncbi:group III truncated hemoglobin [soil metagenome]
MANDIETRDDLTRLMTDFYSVAVSDELIGHHFAGLDLEEHIPVIVDFWEKTLFAKPVYYGNTLALHQAFNERNAMKSEHFTRWVEIFVASVNKLFAGEMADNAIQRARMIADSMNQRLNEESRLSQIGNYRRPF